MDDMDVGGSFRDARRELDSVRAGRAGPGAAQGRGEAADEQVRVFAAGGKVEKIELDPRVMRLPPEALAGHLRTAANAALDEMRAQAPAEQTTVIDPGALAQHLERLADEGLRSLAMITQAIEDGVARVAPRTGMTGDPSPRGLEQLIEEARRSVPAVPDDARAEEPDLGGAGTAAEGRVRARVSSNGRIEELEIDPRVLRSASVELAEQVAAALNGALDDLRAGARDRAGPVAGGVDLERLQALREDSVRQMSAYAGALRDLIASVYRR